MLHFSMQRYILTAILLLLPLCTAFAQKEASVWYFGNNAGMDFIGPTPTIRTNSAMRTAEGCAVISNSSGKLLFYTNGSTVWNSEHQVMDGSGLLGDPSSTQSAIILPQPGDPFHYYIFTVDSEGQFDGLQYHIVNMTRNGGLGQITTKNEPLLPSVVEKMALVRHSNRTDFWLIVHGWNDDVFYAFIITNSGIQRTPVVSRTGTPHLQTTTNLNSLGAMKVSLDGKRIALALYEAGIFEVLDFDASSGRVSATTPPLQLSSPDYTGCYGVEFSPDGTKLYGSVQSSGSMHQFDLALGNAADIMDKAVVVATGSPSIPVGSLQLGPDGRIYSTRMGRSYLDVIERPNEPGILCDFKPQEVFLEGATSTLGLPLFYNGFLHMKFVYRNACPGDNTSFLIPDAEGITSVWWDFGDPITVANNTSSALAPSHVYSAPGSYTVRLTTWRGSTVDIVEREVVIHTVPAPPIPSDTVLCPGTTMFLRAGSPEYIQYEWSTGEVTPQISIDSPGLYWVRVSDKLCTIADTVVVLPAPDWQLTGVSDTTICSGSEVRLSVEGGATYQWNPAKGLDDPTSSAPLARPDATTTYTVTATDIYGCTKQKEITVAVVQQPQAELGKDTIVCEKEILTLDPGQQTSSATYLWSTGETTQSIHIVSPGMYWVVVRDGNCLATDTIRIAHADIRTVSIIPDTSICRGDSVQLLATGALSYQWFADTTPMDPTDTSPVVAPQTTTRYTVLATNELGCTTTAAVTVEVRIPPIVTVSMPTVSADVGSTDIQFPIVLSASEPIALQSLALTVAFDAFSLRPTGISNASMSEQTTGAQGEITIVLSNINVSTAPQVYARLTGDILMGSLPSTALAVQNVSQQQCVDVQTQDGALAIRGCGVGQRDMAFTTPTVLAISPNPATGYAKVQMSSASDCNGDMSVYSLQGQRVWYHQFPAIAGEVQVFLIETTELAPGLYSVIMRAGTDIAVATLLVQQ